VADLTGTHTYQLDPKGRMSLPARFRAVFAEGAWLTLGQEGCLYAFPGDEWQRQSEEARATPQSGPQARAYARMFFGSAERVDLDGQGRLVIPQRLRNQIGLAHEVVVIGVSERLDIWERGAWDRYEQTFSGAYAGGTLAPDGS